MKLRPNKPQDADINLTPLIDMVFLLLIFFMVSTTFDKETRIKVELPEATAAVEEKRKVEPVHISIDAQGRFYVNQEELVNSDFSILKRALEKAVAGQSPLPSVIITADAKTPHQAVMSAMDAASQVGMYEMIFAAKQRSEK
ncbi:MAG: biopolymer transporter ExbD [Gammaproteobacteria bacterium]|nr:biopolymer transporter ExbD [Gammaproteobacteria bacterium]MBU1653694.1 biopolymer transporter ExbD [Gammaproteobacteria bacterium]MBU1960905.1 biopolymer transporter ExbD [Gammaproteobacteria bacterium]